MKDESYEEAFERAIKADMQSTNRIRDGAITNAKLADQGHWGDSIIALGIERRAKLEHLATWLERAYPETYKQWEALYALEESTRKYEEGV